MRKRKVLLTAVVLLIFLCVLAFDCRLAVRRYEITSSKLSAPVRLAVLSDLHSCRYGEKQKNLLDAVAAEQPDAVLLVGDMVDDKLPEEPAWTAIAALAADYPCFYVTGNHEWWGGEGERICRQMDGLGITVLRGERAELSAKGNALVLCGIDDPDAGAEGQLERAAEGLSEERFSLLLAHRPEQIEEYLRYPFDLVVSGHAHGGQWRLPGLVNGLLAPHQGLFPAYVGGRYDFDGAVMLVSRGLARESTRIPRIFNRPELVIVDLLPA